MQTDICKLTDMDNTEIFKLCQISKKQWSHCILHWELALCIVHAGVVEHFRKVPKKSFDALLITVTSLQEHTPWCQTGSFCTATKVLQSRGDVAKRSPTGYPSTLEKLHDEHVIETSKGNTHIHLVQRQDSEGATNLKDLNKIIIELILEHYGGFSKSQFAVSNTFIKSMGTAR